MVILKTFNQVNLYKRYWAASDLTDLDTTLHCWQQLKTELPPDSQYLPDILNNLGAGLSDRYARTGEVEDLERGIEAFQQATQQGLDIATE